MANFAHYLPVGLHSRVSGRVYSLSLCSPKLTTRQQCYLPITGGWIGGCQGMSTCQWAMWHPSPLLQAQFLTFEGYCPLPFDQLHPISARQCVISAKQLVCWLMPAFTSTSLLPLILPFPGGAQWVLGLSQGLPRGNSGSR